MDEQLRPFRNAGARTALITDFDGTLAPIVADPEAVVVQAGAVEALNAWAADGVRVAIVSGRPVETLRRCLPGLVGVELFGVYGMERIRNGVVSLDPRVAAAPTLDIEAAELGARFPSLRIENKLGRVVAVHWREHPEAETDVLAASRSIAARSGASIHHGRMVVELRTVATITKGSTVAEIAHDVDRVVMAGDDTADVEAFRVLRDLRHDGTLLDVCTIAVLSNEAPSDLRAYATRSVDSPAALVEAFGRV